MKKIKINYLLALFVMGGFLFVSCEKDTEMIICIQPLNKHNNSSVQVSEGGDSITHINLVDTSFVEFGSGLVADTSGIIYCNGFICADSANWNYSTQRVIQLYCENQEGASQIQSTNGVLSIGCGLLYRSDSHGDANVYEYQEDLITKTITWTNVSETRNTTEWIILLDQPNKRVLQTVLLCDVNDYCKAEHVITMTLTR